MPNIIRRTPLSRRHFLYGSGIAAIALPILDAMSPRSFAATTESASPKRFVAMGASLGFHGPNLFPTKPGRDYELTPYLKQLAANRDHFTLFSGLSHPEQQGNNGHASELTWLTSAQRPGLAGFRNTISIDQLIADKVGLQTRFPYLTLSTSGRSMSWSSNGVEIPGQTSPAKLFAALFLEGSKQETTDEIANLKRGKSILDTVGGRAKVLENELGQRDKQKLGEYLSAVRDLESRLQQSQEWITKPKPKVGVSPLKDIADRNDAIAKQRLMYDIIALALQTDSTRTITFQLSGMNAVPKVDGVQSDWHGLSHHGKDPAKIDELGIIEAAEFAAFNDFLSKLRNVEENGKTLLDNTAILFGSNLGNASAHDWHNLPIILAGGGYKHGSYVAHDTANNTPLANLFVQQANRMGVETRTFGSSTNEGVQGLA